MYELNQQDKMTYCSKCLYPALAVNLMLDSTGKCSACVLHEQVLELGEDFWQHRFDQLKRIVHQVKDRSMSNYDCVIPVSGGKDSYFQTHMALELGLRPLLVTYHGNNYLAEGQRNLDRMRDVFGVDHMIFGPSVRVLKIMNRVGFEMCGDMNWHAHAGIKTFPNQIAVKYRIPLVIWGEITWSVAGMFDLNDFVQFNKRTVFEHDMRGISVKDFVSTEAGLTVESLPWLKMPSDEEFELAGTIGIYLGNFVPWDANNHTKLMISRYGFEVASKPFERTYRTMSNLDDMHENGVHDYMKFIKFGYGRTTDHASKDIRSGILTRNQGLSLVKTMDHVVPRKDLSRWLNYVEMPEEEFHLTAERFRDPRVWWISDGKWWKSNLWGEPSSYGPVRNLELV